MWEPFCHHFIGSVTKTEQGIDMEFWGKLGRVLIQFPNKFRRAQFATISQCVDLAAYAANVRACVWRAALDQRGR